MNDAAPKTLTPSPTLMAPSWWLARVSKANLAFAVAVVLLVIFASVGTDSFLTGRNLVSISRQIVTNGFLSLGMLLVILTGGIDLSVGAVLAFAGLLATGLQAHMPWPAAIGVALVMGLAVGGVNGILIARYKLQPFIATLATMGSVRGLLYIYSETPQYPADPLFRSLLGGGFIGPMPVPTLLFILALPVVWFYLNHTVSGRALYAIGVNSEAVRLAGINVRRHMMPLMSPRVFLQHWPAFCWRLGSASRSPASVSAMSWTRLPPWSSAGAFWAAAAEPCSACWPACWPSPWSTMC